MVDRIISISFYFDPEKFEMLQSLLENPNSFVYFFVNAPMKLPARVIWISGSDHIFVFQGNHGRF